jgi:hypothetical protein
MQILDNGKSHETFRVIVQILMALVSQSAFRSTEEVSSWHFKGGTWPLPENTEEVRKGVRRK